MKFYHCLNCQKERAISHQKVNKYCSLPCQQEYQNKKRIDDWLTGKILPKKNGTSAWIKRYILEKQNFQCNECGIIDHNGKKLILELDHIDGNPYNNNEDNLRCICPNCHSQSDTYKSKNKGNGRHFRTERYAQGKSY